MASQVTSGRRVVAYVRISRDRDNETSTTTQQAAVEAYCTAHGWRLVQVVVEPGRSAFKASRAARPGFKEAMSYIASGVADTFVVWKIDRAARNTRDLLNFIEGDLAGHGAAFASVTEQFDTSTPMGHAMLVLVAELAQMESAQKSDRARAWHAHRRRTAAVPTGAAPLGYLKPRPNRLELDPRIAPLVRDAVARIIRGASIRSQVLALNDAGISITNPGLKAALRSPTLAGLVMTGDGDDGEMLQGEWEPLIPPRAWHRLQTILADPRRRGHTTSNRLRHPLIPTIRCQCGSRMRVHDDRRQYQQRRYVCLASACKTGITYEAVNEAVTAAVLDHLDATTWHRLRAGKSPIGPDIAAIEARLAAMWQMVLDGRLDPEEYAEAKLRWRGEIAAATTPALDLPDVEDVRQAWGEFTPSEQALVFRAAIERLVIQRATRRGRGVDLSRVDLELAG